ncbi:hypothetical protein FRC06_011907, partial [Ceratobasidium sp. 370]
GKRKAPARSSDDDDSHKEACAVKAAPNKSLEDQKKTIKRRKQRDPDDSDGPAFGDDDFDKDEDDFGKTDNNDNDNDSATKNARLRKDNKSLRDEIRAIRRMCEQAGLRELLNANATPGASGSGSGSGPPAATADSPSLCDVSELADDDTPGAKIPVPTNKGDVKIADIRKMMGLAKSSGSQRWLEMHHSVRDIIVWSKLDIQTPWKGQDKTCLAILCDTVRRNNAEFARFSHNWAAEYLVQEAFNHRRSHWLALRKDELTSGSSSSDSDNSDDDPQERKRKRKEKEKRKKERRKERKKEEREEREREREKAKAAKEKERKERERDREMQNCEHKRKREEREREERQREEREREERECEEREREEREREEREREEREREAREREEEAKGKGKGKGKAKTKAGGLPQPSPTAELRPRLLNPDLNLDPDLPLPRRHTTALQLPPLRMDTAPATPGRSPLPPRSPSYMTRMQLTAAAAKRAAEEEAESAQPLAKKRKAATPKKAAKRGGAKKAAKKGTKKGTKKGKQATDDKDEDEEEGENEDEDDEDGMQDNGDIGRVFEIIKVLRFTFWGGGATNYGNELLELACNYFYEYPADLQAAILNNYLVNPSGLPNHWHKLDLLQEHHNLWIKQVFNKKNSDFDSKFLRRAVSVNIRGFGKLRDTLFHMLGLSTVPTGRSLPDYKHDIDVLATHYCRTDLFTFKPGRSQAFNAVDTFSRGYEKLQSGTLAKFLDRTLTDPDLVCDEGDDQLDLDELEEPPTPLMYDNGVLRPAGDTGLTELFTNMSL